MVMTMGFPCDSDGYDLRIEQCRICGSRGCAEKHSCRSVTPHDAIAGLSERLRQMPSSLNDACRTMEEAATKLESLAKALREPEAEWKFCPECGSMKIHHEEGRHKQCGDCFQEWFSDMDYSDVVQAHLGKNYCDSREAIKKAESRATRAEQERDEAMAALEPFAHDFDLNDCDGRKDDDAMEISIRDLRAARDLVRRLAGPEKEGK